VPEGDAGITGGLASTASQTGASIGLAVLATAASARTAGGHSPGVLAAGYDQVFLIAAGVGLAIAIVSRPLPRPPADARHEAPSSPEGASAHA
jgi:hypothetical protein